MPLHTRNYHWLTCSAKVDNLLQPVCSTSSDAGFGDAEDITQKALDAGWTRTGNGKDVLCPLHSKESVDPPAKAPRKPRATVADTPTPENGPF